MKQTVPHGNINPKHLFYPVTTSSVIFHACINIGDINHTNLSGGFSLVTPAPLEMQLTVRLGPSGCVCESVCSASALCVFRWWT